MIEFHAGEHTDLRLVVKKLGSLIEKSGVVLVTLNHKVSPLAKAIALVEIGQQSAHQAARVHSGHGEEPDE